MPDLKDVLAGISTALVEAIQTLHQSQRQNLRDLETEDPVKLQGVDIPAALLAPERQHDLDHAEFSFTLAMGPFWNREHMDVKVTYRAIDQTEAVQRMRDSGNLVLDTELKRSRNG